MRLHLGGHLGWYDKEKRSDLDVPLTGPVPLASLVAELGLPPGEIAIAVVNGESVELEKAKVADGDHVQLFPPIGGGADFGGRLVRPYI